MLMMYVCGNCGEVFLPKSLPISLSTFEVGVIPRSVHSLLRGVYVLNVWGLGIRRQIFSTGSRG